MPSINSPHALWALVDCNNFFASCERLFRPDLADRPVVVLSNNDGCIVARSNEAKALGIGMGEPEFKVRELLRMHDVAVFSSNYVLYGDIASRVMRTLESIVPEVEQYSIDEAFVPLRGALAANADGIADEMWRRVRRWTGIGVAVGLGATRTLAKIASERAKKGCGVCRLEAGPEANGILEATPVGDVWGIGRKSDLKLRSYDIYTARQLRDADGALIRKLLGIAGTHTALELRGIPCLDAANAPMPRRSMVSSRSFGEKVRDKQYLAEALAMHASLAGERLRKEKLEAGGLTVHIRTSRHGVEAFYDETASITLARPTSSTRDFIHATARGLEAIFRPGYAYAKAGIILYDLAAPGSRPGNLLNWIKTDAGDKKSDTKLMHALDVVNRRFGRGMLRFAAEGKRAAPWHVKSDRRSPRATTAWDELPVVKC
ncbi:MAG: Y-family DNA polymerase [Desulfovibrio sp.]|jgi:DNA polymerase V|nr:Y-family DNA polymerase [Desulfovibrio sp.]